MALATSTADFTILRLWETTLSVVKKLFNYMGIGDNLENPKKILTFSKRSCIFTAFLFSIRVLHESDSNHRIYKKWRVIFDCNFLNWTDKLRKQLRISWVIFFSIQSTVESMPSHKVQFLDLELSTLRPNWNLLVIVHKYR